MRGSTSSIASMAGHRLKHLRMICFAVRIPQQHCWVNKWNIFKWNLHSPAKWMIISSINRLRIVPLTALRVKNSVAYWSALEGRLHWRYSRDRVCVLSAAARCSFSRLCFGPELFLKTERGVSGMKSLHIASSVVSQSLSRSGVRTSPRLEKEFAWRESKREEKNHENISFDRFTASNVCTRRANVVQCVSAVTSNYVQSEKRAKKCLIKVNLDADWAVA